MTAVDGRTRPCDRPGDALHTTNNATISDASDIALWMARVAAFERGLHYERYLEAVQDAGIAMLPGARKIWADPRFDELEARREEVVMTGCSLRSGNRSRHDCDGRCSRCVRAYAVEKNRRLYDGSPDFPGVNELRARRREGAA